MPSICISVSLQVGKSQVVVGLNLFHWAIICQNGHGLTNLGFGPFRLMLQPQLWTTEG